MSSTPDINSLLDETSNQQSTVVEPNQQIVQQECSPEAYLETLDSVVACSRLLNTQSCLLDQEQIDKVCQLLQRAKTLFVDNTISLVLQSLKDVHRDKPLPLFWSQVSSQHECNIWIRLFDIILFCWSKDIILNEEKSAISHSFNRKCGNFVEHQVFQYQTEIRRLRNVYKFPSERNDLKEKLVESIEKMNDATQKVKQVLRPMHIILLSSLKDPKDVQPLLLVASAVLEILELTCAESNVALSFLDTKLFLGKLSFFHLDKFSNIHKNKLNARVVNKLRNYYLQNSAFNETTIKKLESHLKTKEWKCFIPLAVELLRWMIDLEEYDRIYQLNFTVNDEKMRHYIQQSLPLIVRQHCQTIQHFPIWKTVPKELLSKLTPVEINHENHCANQTLLHLKSSELANHQTKHEKTFATFRVDVKSATIRFN